MLMYDIQRRFQFGIFAASLLIVFCQAADGPDENVEPEISSSPSISKGKRMDAFRIQA